MNNQYSNWVEDYLDRKLDTNQQKEFETALSKDKELQAEMSLQQDMVALLKAETKIALKKELAPLWQETKDNQKQNESGRIRFFSPMTLGIAAAVLLLLTWGFFSQRTENHMLTLTDQYLSEAHALPILLKSDQQMLDADWQKIGTFYRAGDYKAAAIELQEVIQTKKPSGQAYFYLGLCQLYRVPSLPEEAITSFKRAGSSGFSAPQSLEWYQCLALIKAGETEEARTDLQSYIEKWKEDGWKISEARALLDK